jgi:hypothetical protein
MIFFVSLKDARKDLSKYNKEIKEERRNLKEELNEFTWPDPLQFCKITYSPVPTTLHCCQSWHTVTEAKQRVNILS